MGASMNRRHRRLTAGVCCLFAACLAIVTACGGAKSGTKKHDARQTNAKELKTRESEAKEIEAKKQIEMNMPISFAEPWKVVYTQTGTWQDGYTETMMWSQSKPTMLGALASDKPTDLPWDSGQARLQTARVDKKITIKSVVMIAGSNYSIILIETAAGWYTCVTEPLR
jgi:hypothetical protein